MTALIAGGHFRVVEVAGAPGTWLLEPQSAPFVLWAIAGYRGDALPAELHAAVLERADEPGRPPWRLSCREGSVHFDARSVERMRPLPALFAPLLERHALRPRDRRIVRLLLALLRLPGGAWLLRAWQVRRR